MKRLLILSSLLLIALVGCLKDTAKFDNLSNSKTFVTFPLGGITNFAGDAITAAADTIQDTVALYVNSSNPTTKAYVINLGADFDKVTSYNALDKAITYLPMPAGSYVIPPTVTVPAGKSTAIVPITLYKNKLDVSKSFMLPVSITGGGGLSLSSNYNTHYLHFIGNPLAGPVNYLYLRYNNGIGPSAGPPSTTTLSKTVLSPVNPTQFEMASSYAGAVRYEVSFTNTAGVYSDFQVSFNADDVKNIWGPAGVTIVDQPVIVTADPIKGIYEFQYKMAFGTARRFIVDKYYK